ncbi:hypothetical protein, partial [Candidatus Thiosymbion oneisti]|uniref:hypothetical protein n=1 Tax=Candidatus Thiosymbion oneisti TaxID=589554 RepID=UPI001C402CD4
MDSGLLWSAPAKRRDRIEPQRRGILAALAKNLGLGSHTRRGDGAFPWPQRLCRGWMRRQIQSGGGFAVYLPAPPVTPGTLG